MNWESLIAERIAAHRDTYAPQRIEDAGKRNAARNQKRWRENNPDKVRDIYDRENLRRRTDPECIAHRRELERSPARKAYKKQYKQEHRERMNELHRNYNATEKGKATNSAYNKKWRESHKEYDRERKQKWWRFKHPNPRPVGRPKKGGGIMTESRERYLEQRQELYRHPEPKPEFVHCCKCGKADKRTNMGVVGYNVYKCWECLAGITEVT